MPIKGAAVTRIENWEWSYLGRELQKRTWEPLGSVAFVVYFFLSTILFGCLGISIEVVKVMRSPGPVELAGIITAVIAFFPTLVGPTALQLVFASHKRNDTAFLAIAVLILCVSAVTAIVLAIFSPIHPVPVLVIGIGCSVVAIWMWWIANGDNPTFKSTPPDAATGGDPTRGLGGTLSGFQA
jgi:hypothetical protein